MHRLSRFAMNSGIIDGARTIAAAAAAETTEVLVQSAGAVRTITLNRPKALNALNLAMVRRLTPLYKADYAAPDSSVLYLMHGEGEKAFCAGGDIKSIAVDIGKDPRAADPPMTVAFFREEYQLNHMIGTTPHTQVALLDGITMGGGVGLSVHGAFRVATERTVFAMPEVAIGFFCDVGGTHFLPRLAGGLGPWLALTGARLKGADVAHAGIATHYVPSDALPALVEKLAASPSKSRDAIGALLDGACQLKSTAAGYAAHQASIDSCFAEQSSVEAVLAALDADGSEWAGKQRAAILKACPTSVKVVLESLRRGKTLDLAECLNMEFRMTQRFMTPELFGEGVTALLVDKRPSVWRPDSLAAVSDADVAKFFDRLDDDLEWKPLV